MAAAIRIYSLTIGTMNFDADEAVTGLMVRRILAGQQNYLYFAGQTYNGSLEQYIQAAFYAVLPVPRDAFTLRLVEVGLSVLTMLATYRLARLVLRRCRYALLAALIFAIGPPWNIIFGTRSYGSYDSTQLLSVLGLICAIRALPAVVSRASGSESSDGSSRRLSPPAWAGLFGLCVGLILWLGWTGLEVLVPAGVWLLPLLLRSIKALGAAVLGTVLGFCLPIAWMIRHHQLVGVNGGPQPHTTFWVRLDRLWNDVGSEFVGMKLIRQVDEWPIALQHVVLASLVACWLVAFAVRWRGVLDIATLRTSFRRPGDLLLIVPPLALIAYCSSAYAWYYVEPRYVFVLYPIFCIGLAGLASVILRALATLAGRVRLPVAQVGTALTSVVVAAVVVFAVVASVRSVSRYLVDLLQGRATPANLKQADAWLVAHGELHVYADYWTALPAQYLATDPALHIAPWRSGIVKAQFARTAVDHSGTFVYMTSTRSGAAAIGKVEKIFAAHHMTYRKTVIGSVDIYDELKPPIRPAKLKLPS